MTTSIADLAPTPGQIQAALAHLHDPAYLEMHPLGALRGRTLRLALLEALEQLKTPRGTPANGRDNRAHDLLRLRYVEALPVDDVQARLLIGRSEYYRAHERALAAVAVLLTARLETTRASAEGGRPSLSGNLPSYLTRFLGRDREMAEVDRRLADGHRLVSLVGPGGAGKTRLAVEVAHSLGRSHQRGVWFVDLASLESSRDADPAPVAERALAAVGGFATGQESAVAALLRCLAGRQALLVVDNCEQVAEAAARVVETVLGACPRIQALVTSREPLGIGGELVLRVEPLAAPSLADRVGAQDALSYPAVALFADRAALAEPGSGRSAFRLEEANVATVARICRRLDGLPLAIELAAARASAMSVADIAERLDDLLRAPAPFRTRPDRHRTLHALIGWSHDLLEEPERTLYRRLSVFAGPFTVAAAEAVAGFGALAPSDVVGLLVGLAGRSLIVPDIGSTATTYRLLETIRADAAMRLAGSGETDEARRRHAGYFAAMNRRLLEPSRIWSGDTLWSGQIDEMRSALGWALAAEDAELALALVRGVTELNHVGALREARVLVEATLALPCDDRPDLATTRFHAFATAALTALRSNDVAGGVAWAEAARSFGAAHGMETLGAAVAAHTALWSGDYAAHDRIVAPMLDAHRGRPYARIALGDSARAQGDLPGARRWYEQQAGRQPDGDPMESWLLRGLGHLARREGAVDDAERFLIQSIALYGEARDRSGQIEALCGLAGCALDRGDAARAVRVASAIEALLEETGSRLYPPDRAELEPVVAAARKELGEAAFETAVAAGRRLTLEQAIADALGGREIAPASSKSSTAGTPM